MLDNLHIEWLGHDCFRILAGSTVVYIDPYQLTRRETADLILISHDHFDHCSPDDVARLRGSQTAIVAPPSCARKLGGAVTTIRPGDQLTIQGIPIEAVAAYNVSKFRAPGQPFHPRDAGGVGYVITVDGQRIYHTGDSDAIPEMTGLQVDVALLPVSGTYVMTAEEAAELANRLQPKLAIPMHYGAIVGSEADARRFQQLTRVPVTILSKQ
ncbi:MAG: MBL fold metallo-hydrolase [Chloroflexi bacterium]|nr:MBL fold metallo-hydrolase [Chloroflexota bacterium]